MISKMIWSSGSNGSGQLGDATNIVKSSPVSIARLSSYKSIAMGPVASSSIGTNGFFSIAIDAITGMIYSWGQNSRGPVEGGWLGDNTKIAKNSPVAIARTGSYVAVAKGMHALAIDGATGMIWSWGSNSVGQLGDNTTIRKSSPVAIARTGSYLKVAAGTNGSDSAGISAAIDSTGVVWMWGSNVYGQLGDGTTVNNSSPVSILSSGFYRDVAVGLTAVAVIRASDGMIETFGNNSTGQLGDNAIDNQSSPVAIARTGSYSKIAGGADSFLAIDGATGMIWAWGVNDVGQLGDNTIDNQSSPVAIARTGSYVEISASSHSLAIDSTGVVWAWGLNNYGQLGDNTTINASSPVSIAKYQVLGYSSISAGNGFSSFLDNFQDVPLTCWSYIAKYKGTNRMFKLNGPGLFPNELKVPGNVDVSSGVMIDEGKLIDPSMFKIIQ